MFLSKHQLAFLLLLYLINQHRLLFRLPVLRSYFLNALLKRSIHNSSQRFFLNPLYHLSANELLYPFDQTLLTQVIASLFIIY